MAVTADRAMQLLNKLVKELDNRRADIDTYDKAYRGEHRLQFASDNFKEFFAARYQHFSDNWCGIVADAPHERLEVTGFRLPDQPKGDEGFHRAWRRNDADTGSDLAFLDAIITGRAFAMVWAEDDDTARITWEHASQAIVSYDPETRERSAGAKVWGDDEREYATLYLADEIWKFQRDRFKSSLELPSYLTDGGWVQREVDGEPWPVKNPLNKVPLVEFTNRPRVVGEPMSDVKGALAMQHAINLLWAQLFAVSDEATIGQRIILGAEQPVMPILDENGNQVGERPVDLKKIRKDNILWIEDPNAKAHEWKPAALNVFTDIIEIGVGHVAAQSRTPAHYMLIGGTIANVPEGGLKALEAGLASRTREKTLHFGKSVRDLAELVALVEEPSKAAAVREGHTLWRDVENRSDAQRADALQKKRDIGYPIRYLLELDGLPPAEIDRVMAMIREEQSDPILSRILRPAGGNMPGASDGDDGDTAGGN